MASIIKRSPATIHSLETGRLALSESLATQISLETGVSLSWLLAGDPRKPMVGRDGEPYSKKVFEQTQAKQISDIDRALQWSRPPEYYADIRAILRSALKRGDFELADYKISRALRELEREFGRDDEEEFADGADFKVTVERLIEKDLRYSPIVLKPPARFSHSK